MKLDGTKNNYGTEPAQISDEKHLELSSSILSILSMKRHFVPTKIHGVSINNLSKNIYIRCHNFVMPLIY